MVNGINKIIYSPVEQIPIGEPVQMTDGRPALRIRYTTTRNQHKEEIIPLDYIFSETINAALSRNSQTSRDSQAQRAVQ